MSWSGAALVSSGVLGAWTTLSARHALAEVNRGMESPLAEERRLPRWSVSLLTPAYNEQKYIGRLLQSASNQVEPFAEAVVADCSDPGDRTVEIAASYGAQVVRAPYGNISRSRNLAASVASGQVLCFADADMTFSQNFLWRALDALEQGAILVSPRLVYYDSAWWNTLLHLPQQLRRGTLAANGCQVMPAEVFWAVGGLDETCNPMEHWCLEMIDLARRVEAAYGPGSVQVVPFLAGTSARRYNRFGISYGTQNFSVSVRDQVASVPGAYRCQ